METILIVAVVTLALIVLMAAGAWLLWRRVTADQRRLIKRIARLPLRSKLRLAARLAADPRIPLLVRALPPALILYLAMPLDVVPDFIPVLGQLDDAVVVLVGVTLLLRFAPRAAIEQQLAAIEQGQDAAEGVPGADP